MKTKILLLLPLFYFNYAFSQQQNCTNTTNVYKFTHNSKVYEIVKELKTWINAAACAVERGGYLAEINNQNEQNSIYDAIINGAGIATNYATVNDGGGIAYVWIGATDKNIEGTWLWDGNNDNIGTNFLEWARTCR